MERDSFPKEGGDITENANDEGARLGAVAWSFRRVVGEGMQSVVKVVVDKNEEIVGYQWSDPEEAFQAERELFAHAEALPALDVSDLSGLREIPNQKIGGPGVKTAARIASLWRSDAAFRELLTQCLGAMRDTMAFGRDEDFENEARMIARLEKRLKDASPRRSRRPRHP